MARLYLRKRKEEAAMAKIETLEETLSAPKARGGPTKEQREADELMLVAAQHGKTVKITPEKDETARALASRLFHSRDRLNEVAGFKQYSIVTWMGKGQDDGTVFLNVATQTKEQAAKEPVSAGAGSNGSKK